MMEWMFANNISNKLSNIVDKNSIDVYRDDGLGYRWNKGKRKLSKFSKTSEVQ